MIAPIFHLHTTDGAISSIQLFYSSVFVCLTWLIKSLEYSVRHLTCYAHR